MILNLKQLRLVTTSQTDKVPGNVDGKIKTLLGWTLYCFVGLWIPYVYQIISLKFGIIDSDCKTCCLSETYPWKSKEKAFPKRS